MLADTTASGDGAFAIVRKGISKKDGRAYAIKYIDKVQLKEEDTEMLKSECEVLKSVRHPNVVRLFEIYDTPKELILVMEFVAGGEMLDKLKALGTYSEAEASNRRLSVGVGITKRACKNLRKSNGYPKINGDTPWVGWGGVTLENMLLGNDVGTFF